jgi:hypothetical protein
MIHAFGHGFSAPSARAPSRPTAVTGHVGRESEKAQTLSSRCNAFVSRELSLIRRIFEPCPNRGALNSMIYRIF